MSKYGFISGPHFPVFGLNMERERYYLSVFSPSECRKIQTKHNFVHISRSDYLLHWGEDRSTINTYFQLNLVFIAKSPTGFRSAILWKQELKVRRSHWSRSIKIGVLKYFANFTGKHLCWSLFLTVFRIATFSKSVSNTGVFF